MIEQKLRERLITVCQRYDEQEAQLADPAVLADSRKLQQIAKAHAELRDVVARFRAWENLEKQLLEAREMMKDGDPEITAMAETEAQTLEPQMTAAEKEIRLLMLPKDPMAERNTLVEIRGAAGGDEAALFAGDLAKMYCLYAESKGWKTEVIHTHPGEVGGYKEIVLRVIGTGAFSRLRFEGGIHRVQRVPATESQGRIHTSTASVAVLAEAEEVDLVIQENDLRIDTYCSSGPGGQGVNTTYSAVRITHVPTGTVVTCQDERSQIKNKASAMRVLRSRLLEAKQAAEAAKQGSQRKAMVGTGDRSEKIRTYNFPENRLTDHRINFKVNRLPEILGGELDALIDSLTADYQSKMLAEG